MSRDQVPQEQAAFEAAMAEECDPVVRCVNGSGNPYVEGDSKAWLAWQLRAALATTAPAPVVIEAAALAQSEDDLHVLVHDALANEIGSDAYDCTRVWGGWSVGTMTQDDFVPVIERLDDISRAVIHALKACGKPGEGAALAQPAAQPTDQFPLPQYMSILQCGDGLYRVDAQSAATAEVSVYANDAIEMLLAFVAEHVVKRAAQQQPAAQPQLTVSKDTADAMWEMLVALMYQLDGCGWVDKHGHRLEMNQVYMRVRSAMDAQQQKGPSSQLSASSALLSALIKARDELAGIPQSLGYSFTHLPEIDAAIANAQKELSSAKAEIGDAARRARAESRIAEIEAGDNQWRRDDHKGF